MARIGLPAVVTVSDLTRMAPLNRSARQIKAAIAEGLVQFAHNGEIAPRLARQWFVSEDRRRWTFLLRQEVRFHDGRHFTAAAVAAHFTRLLQAKGSIQALALLGYIDDVKATEAFRIEFTLRHPWPGFLYALALPTTASLITAVGEGNAPADRDRIIGTGPFKLSQANDDGHITLLRNNDYWQPGRPYLQGLSFQAMADEQSRLASLKSARIDLTWSDNAAFLQQAAKETQFTLMATDAPGTDITLLNLSKPPLSDEQFRQALAYAWDQESYVAQLYGPTRPVIAHIFAHQYECQDSARIRVAPDLLQARVILADYNAPLMLSLLIPDDAQSRRQAAVIQEIFAPVGITITLEPVSPQRLAERLFAGDYQLGFWRLPAASDMGPQLFALHHSKSSSNLNHIRQAELDHLLLSYRAAVDLPTAKEKACAISDYINRSAHIHFRGGRRNHLIAANSLQNLPPMQHGVVDWTGVWLAP